MPIDVQFPGNLGQVDTIAKLRQVPTSGVDAETLYVALDVGRTYSFDFGSLLNDDGINVIRPNDRMPLQAGRFIYLVDGFAPGKAGNDGPAGPADNTYTTLAALLASDPARKSARLVPQLGETAPAGNFNYINGAWVRQGAEGINYTGRAPGIVRSTQTLLAEGVKAKADFGAAGNAQRVRKPDGSPDEANFTGTDDTAALQNAMAEAMGNGFEFRVERGSYLISGPLTATLNEGQQQPRFVGAGRALTEFIQTNKQANGIHIYGNMPVRDQFYMGGFRVTYPDSWSIGVPTGRAVVVENVRGLTLDNIRTFRAGIGFNIIGCLDAQLRELVTFYDRNGMKLERGSYDSFPNAISFDRCEIQASYKMGLEIVGGCAITVAGATTIENVGVENGTLAGPGSEGRSVAMVLTESGFAGSVAIKGMGLYFEANRDYNIYINHANRAALYKFDACNFNRFNDIRIVNDIVFDCQLGNVATAPAVLDVSGCSFTGFNGYTPDANKQKIAFTTPNGYSGLDFVDNGTLYGEAIERPRVPINVAHVRPVDVQAFSSDGSLEDSRGIRQITKVSDGIYRIYPLRGATGLVVTFTRQASAAGGQTLSRISDRTADYIEVTFETIATTPVATATSFFVTGSYAQ